MTSTQSVGRIIGMLLFVQLASALLAIFVLLGPLTSPPGLLANAAGSSLRVSIAALLWLLTGAVALGIAIVAVPVFRQCSETMALWLLALSVVGLPLCAAETLALLSMLSLSQSYAQAGAADPGLFEALGTVIGSARRWARYTYALVGSGMTLVFYSILYRFALTPRALAAVGLVTAMLHLIASTMPFLGYGYPLVLQVPLALTNLVVALWLMARGFDERPDLFRPEARRGGPELSGA